jgi:hypothetical protein
MKKLFSLLIVFAFLSVGAFAQAKAMTGSGVTVTNTATVACSLQVAQSYTTVTVGAVIAKTSGTLAGTLTLQGSLDGTTWETVPTALVAGAASTYTVTDVASQNKAFVVTGSPYLYYRLSWTGTGTMVGTLSGAVLARNYFK